MVDPPSLLSLLGEVDLDPCPAPDPKPWETAKHYCVDGLKEDWSGFVFCNPPYSDGMAPWIDKMAAHNNGILLIFARTETPYGQKAIKKARSVLFLEKRLYFHYANGDRAKGNSGGPSMLCAYGEDAHQRLLSIKHMGYLMEGINL